jgi:uncharacterized protein (TIGR02118 family)
VAEAWFDDTQAMRELAPSAEYAAVRADEANFIDAASMRVVLTDERVVVDGAAPRGAVKLIAFLPRRQGLAVDRFQAHWREVHGPLAAAVPGCRRYVQCHARPGIYASGREPAYDGIAMLWFDDREALSAAGESAAFQRTLADEPSFLAPGPRPFVVASEVEIATGDRR